MCDFTGLSIVLSIVTMFFTIFCKESIEDILNSIKRTFTPGDCINESSTIEIKFPPSSFPSGFPATVLRAKPDESEVVQSGITHKILGHIIENRVQIIFSILVGLFIDHVAPALFGC